MPPSGCSPLILELLDQSGAKVNNKRKKEVENIDHSRINKNVKSKDDLKQPKRRTIYQLKEDIINSVVHNHLKKVSPKLAKEFAYKFTIVEDSLKLESVVGSSYRKLVNMIKEYDNTNQNVEVSQDKTFRSEVIQGRLRPRCKKCNIFFFDNSTLKRHNLVHTGDKSHICDLCNKAFSRAGHLKIHKITHYTEKRPGCNISISQDSDIEQNRNGILRQERKNLVHSRKNTHRCTLCGKSFSKSSDLNRHTLVHSKVKPFSCNICGNAFSRAFNLEQHKRKHSGDNPYNCNSCGKSFSYHMQLMRHNSVHNKSA